MEKKVLLKKLVEEGRHIRKEFTPTAIVSDNGVRPIGEFWDANKTIDVIVNGAEIAHDTIREVDELAHEIERNLATEETRAKGAESDLQDAIGAEVTRATAAEQHLDDIKADKTDLENNYLKNYIGPADLGHEYVDLGLPSGTLWAKTNVGASSETGYGTYYMYGHGSTSYNSSQTDYSGTENPLSPSVDTATQVWGNGWHMPTKTQVEELIANTNYTWVTIDGINGGKFTCKTDSTKYIFLPAGGDYFMNYPIQWRGEKGFYLTSTPKDSANAYLLTITSTNPFSKNGGNSIGATVRPVHATVYPSTQVPVSGVTDVEKTAWNNKSDFSGSYNDLTNKPTNVSAFTNDAGYLTLHQDISGKADKTDLNDYLKNYIDVDPTGGHDYVEIGGIKWATMNIGAESVTDYGLYFQWGDTLGYTASQVGSGEGQKAFLWPDYKYSNNNGTVMTKYNDTDGKTVLDASDDAATVNMGSGWRMPTNEEYAALGNAVNTEWTTNYQDSGVAGIICTDKTDSSKVLFFPACGNCYNGSVSFTGNHGVYLSSSLYDSDVQRAHDLSFGYGSIFDNSVKWQDYSMRYGGNTVRGVYVGPDPQRIPVSGVTADEKTSWNAKIDQTTFNSLVARVEALEQAQ